MEEVETKEFFLIFRDICNRESFVSKLNMALPEILPVANYSTPLSAGFFFFLLVMFNQKRIT